MSIPSRLHRHRTYRNLIIIVSLLCVLIGLMTSIAVFLLGLLLINSYSYVLMGYDKRLAVNHRSYRIPEKSFFLLGLCFGSVGIVLAMICLHHKSKHRRFIAFYVLAIVHLYLLYLYVRLTV